MTLAELVKRFQDATQKSNGDVFALNDDPLIRDMFFTKNNGRYISLFESFKNKISKLFKIYNLLYQNESIKRALFAFKNLRSRLIKIRQYRNLSKDKKLDNQSFQKAIEEFDDNLPEEFSRRYLPENKNLEDWIKFAEFYIKALRVKPKKGRPPKPFNALLFHAVNLFTERLVTQNRKHIVKNSKIRARKNWRLIFAAILWLHVNYQIPKFQVFINKYANEDSEEAIKKFASWAKREYSHFQETGKGFKKFAPWFLDGSEWLDIRVPYFDETRIGWRLI